jgi:hypothetical protein
VSGLTHLGDNQQRYLLRGTPGFVLALGRRKQFIVKTD